MVLQAAPGAGSALLQQLQRSSLDGGGGGARSDSGQKLLSQLQQGPPEAGSSKVVGAELLQKVLVLRLLDPLASHWLRCAERLEDHDSSMMRLYVSCQGRSWML